MAGSPGATVPAVTSATLDVLRVFVGSDGEGGNPLGVFCEGSAIPAARRQAVAADLGYSETVFIDDQGRGELRIFTPTVELPLAGHPLVGAAWLLRRRGRPVETLRPPAGEVPTWVEQGLTWIRAAGSALLSFELLELATPAAVEAHPGAEYGEQMLMVWSWIEERAGHLRARVFPTAAGIAEDEATGAAALRLAATLGRPLRIHQGRGSLLLARPGPDGSAEVGGRTVMVQTRPYALAG